VTALGLVKRVDLGRLFKHVLVPFERLPLVVRIVQAREVADKSSITLVTGHPVAGHPVAVNHLVKLCIKGLDAVRLHAVVPFLRVSLLNVV